MSSQAPFTHDMHKQRVMRSQTRTWPSRRVQGECGCSWMSRKDGCNWKGTPGNSSRTASSPPSIAEQHHDRFPRSLIFPDGELVDAQLPQACLLRGKDRFQLRP